MEIRVVTLGTLSVYAGGERVPSLPSQPVRCAVLVTLAVEREVARETLLGLLWPERDPRRGRHALSQALYQLRGVLGDDWVRAERDKLLATDDLHSDAVEFESAARAGEHDRALDLYGGRFLAGSRLASVRAFEEWVDRTETRLSRLHRRIRRAEIERLVEAGAGEAALDMARGWVELDPLADEARHRLIELLAGSGRQAEALRQYESYARLLRKEFGGEPLGETRSIIEDVLDRAAVSPGPGVIGATPDPPEPPDGGDDADRRWNVIATAVLLLLGAIAVRRRQGRERRPGRRRVPVVFAGFAAAADADPGDVAVLAGRLPALVAGGGRVRAVAARLLEADEPDWRSVPLAELFARARTAGADYMVAGLLGGSGDSAVVSVYTYAVDSGRHVRWTGGPGAGESTDEALERIAVRVASHVTEEAGLEADAMSGLAGAFPAARSHLRRARRRLAEDDVDGAVADLLRAMRADPKLAAACLRLGGADRAEDFGDALDAIEAALRDDDVLPPLARLLRSRASRRGARQEIGPEEATRAGARGSRRPDRKQPIRAAARRLERGDEAEVRRTLAELAEAEQATLSLLIAHFARGARDPALVDALAGLLRAPERPPHDRLCGARYSLVARAMQGRWEDGLAVWAPFAGAEAIDPWLLEAHFAGFPAGPHAGPMLELARRWLGEGRLPAYDRATDDEARLAFQALVYEATLEGDAATVNRLLRASDRGGAAAGGADPLPTSLEASLQARLAVLADDTEGAIAHLGQAVARPPYSYTTFIPLTSLAPQRLLLAELLAGRGRADRAARIAASFFDSPAIADGFYLRRAAPLRSADRASGPGGR